MQRILLDLKHILDNNCSVQLGLERNSKVCIFYFTQTVHFKSKHSEFRDDLFGPYVLEF